MHSPTTCACACIPCTLWVDALCVVQVAEAKRAAIAAQLAEETISKKLDGLEASRAATQKQLECAAGYL